MNEKDRTEIQQVVEMLVSPIAAALNRIADALEKQAEQAARQVEATIFVGRATAGEFDDHSEDGSEPLPTSISQVPRGNGMGMG